MSNKSLDNPNNTGGNTPEEESNMSRNLNEQATIAKNNAQAVTRDVSNGTKDGFAAVGIANVTGLIQKRAVAMGAPADVVESEFATQIMNTVVTPFLLREVGSNIGGQLGNKMHKLASHGSRGAASAAAMEIFGPLVDELTSVINACVVD